MFSVHILTGPTGSGKSAKALAMAQARNGVIINADAMQCYADLRILTARPNDAAMQQVPHRLYGVLDVCDVLDAARWVGMAVQEIRIAWERSQWPLLVGGTGMYLKALMQGIAEIPPVPPKIREEVRNLARQEGAGAVHRRLQGLGDAMAIRLKEGDTQRLSRALEIHLATGRSLAEWQATPPALPLPEAVFTSETITLPRPELYARIDTRFDQMMAAGALEEARALWRKVQGFAVIDDSMVDDRKRESGETSIIDHRSSDYPLLRAHGVPEMFAYFEGRMGLDEAVHKAKQNTRNYAKRQGTWIRSQRMLD